MSRLNKIYDAIETQNYKQGLKFCEAILKKVRCALRLAAAGWRCCCQADEWAAGWGGWLARVEWLIVLIRPYSWVGSVGR